MLCATCTKSNFNLLINGSDIEAKSFFDGVRCSSYARRQCKSFLTTLSKKKYWKIIPKILNNIYY